MNLCKCGCGQEVINEYVNGHYWKGKSNGKLGFKLSEETKRKISESNKGTHNSGGRRFDLMNWIRSLTPEQRKAKFGHGKGRRTTGNTEGWYHGQAWKLFGKDKCELCDRLNSQEKEITGRRLAMHCNSDDYKLLTAENWKCVCKACHVTKLDAGRKSTSSFSSSLLPFP